MEATGLARLGKDAELHTTQSGETVASIALAFSYGRKDANGNRPTQWVDASLWGKRAQVLTPYLKKGGQVYVVLEDVHIQTFEGRNGPGHKLAARVVQLELAGPAPQQHQGAQQQYHQAPTQQQAQQNPQNDWANYGHQQPQKQPAMGAFDDDIPF